MLLGHLAVHWEDGDDGPDLFLELVEEGVMENALALIQWSFDVIAKMFDQILRLNESVIEVVVGFEEGRRANEP